jgi:hypothetical protein
MENQNQTQTLILIAVGAVAAYFLFFKNKEGMEDIFSKQLFKTQSRNFLSIGNKKPKMVQLDSRTITNFA